MRIPVIPTIVVLLACAIMVWLGIWQLGRADEKAELIARYEAAAANAEYAHFPYEDEGDQVWFRKSSVYCGDILSLDAVAGTSAQGQKGWVHRASCADYFAEATVTVDLGFSPHLDVEPSIEQVFVEGTIAPGPRLVADPSVAGLALLAMPDPNDLPNNHLSYAVQWFLFALTALVIYILALRRRGR